MKEIFKKLDKKKMIWVWRIMPLVLIGLLLVIVFFFSNADIVKIKEILLPLIFIVFYNLYFVFIFPYFLKNYFDITSNLKKNIFKILTVVYLIMSAVSIIAIALTFMFFKSRAGIWDIIIFGPFAYMFFIVIVGMAIPLIGIIYLSILQPFPFLKKIKASIFNTEKRKLVWYDYLTAFTVPAFLVIIILLIDFFFTEFWF